MPTARPWMATAAQRTLNRRQPAAQNRSGTIKTNKIVPDLQKPIHFHFSRPQLDPAMCDLAAPDGQSTTTRQPADASQTSKIALDLQKPTNFHFSRPQVDPAMGGPGLPAP